MTKNKPQKIIENERLKLRPVAFDDVTDEYVSWLNDPEVNQFLEVRFQSHTLGTVRDFVEKTLNDSNSEFFAIVRKDVSKFIGTIKLGPINNIHHFADMSIVIGDRASWGKGYASEAISLFTDYAFKNLKMHKIFAGLYAENIGSFKAFLKAGYHEEFRSKNQYLIDRKRFTDRIVLTKFNESYEM